MDDDKAKMDQCKTDIKITRTFRDEIPAIVEELASSCTRHDCFDHVGPEPIPSREAIIDTVHMTCRILYPGYFILNPERMINAHPASHFHCSFSTKSSEK